MMKSIVIIPARYKSTRFPGKPLVKLLGKPMILWVAELSARAIGKENVYIATDDDRISAVVERAGYNSVITSNQCQTGTDRLAEVASKIEADIYVNVQGDEPMVDPNDILAIIKEKEQYPNYVINGCCPLDKNEDPENINIPKVIFTEDGRMVYMSRRPLPGYKSPENAPDRYFKQVCIYAFNREELLAYGEYARKSELEQAEDIEILRFLEWDQKIRLVHTRPGSLAVDIPEDVVLLEKKLLEYVKKDD